MDMNLAFHEDLLGRYGRRVDTAALDRGSFRSHQDLADALLADPLPTRPRLILVTQALPDLLPFTAVAPHIDHRLHGNDTDTLCMGLSQAGISAPFIALRTASAYAIQDRYREAAIFILEQSTLPSPRPTASREDLADSGVLLLTGDQTGYVPRTVRSAASADALETLARSLLAESVPTVAILGHALGWDDISERVMRPPAGHYATGIWAAYADLTADPSAHRLRVLLADADPATGDYHLALLESQDATGPLPHVMCNDEAKSE
jgi:hypothetical protein